MHLGAILELYPIDTRRSSRPFERPIQVSFTSATSIFMECEHSTGRRPTFPKEFSIRQHCERTLSEQATSGLTIISEGSGVVLHFLKFQCCSGFWHSETNLSPSCRVSFEVHRAPFGPCLNGVAPCDAQRLRLFCTYLLRRLMRPQSTGASF